MLTGDKIYSSERCGYLQEIDALRIKAARTEELEAENRKVNAELEDARQWHRERPKFDQPDGISGVNRSIATIKADARTGVMTVDIEEYNRVKEDFAKLESDYGKLVCAREYLVTKLREQKESLRQWKEYRKNWILKHPNKRISHLRPSSARASSVIIAEDRRSSSAPAPPEFPEGLTPSPSGLSRSPSPHHNAPANPKDIECRHDETFDHHSRDRISQSRETSVSRAGRNAANASDSGEITEATPDSGPHAEPVKIEPATGGSSPIIISERSLKRRNSGRSSVQKIHVHEDDQRYSDAAPRNLPPKDEQSSSPIHAPPLIHLDGPHDSLDLDDVGGHLDTPRKRQRMAQERLRSSLMAPLTAVQGEEDVLDNVAEDANLQYLDNEQTEMEDERGRTLPGKPAEEEKTARRKEKKARQYAHNDRIHQRVEATERRDSIFDPPRSSSPITDEFARHPHTPKDPREVRQQKPQLASPVILQPRDVNASVLPRTSDPLANRRRPVPPSRRDRGAAYVPQLAEDGEGLPSKRKSIDDPNNLHGPLEKEPKAPPIHHRLGALLDKPSPEKSLLIPDKPVTTISPDQPWFKVPTPRSVYHSRSKGPITPRSLPAKRSEHQHGPNNKSGLADFSPIDTTTDRYSKSAQAVTKNSKDRPAFLNPPPVDPSETRPEHEPLRARPIHRLSLQDFKLNLAYGDYAFHETVRKLDEKKSLSGCTDRHCQRCKGLRQYVTDSGYKTAQKPGESEDQADWRLLRNFLGDNHRQLKTMSSDERSDLLTEAKVKEFANRFGCHREAFSRSREPPGFWELDFPSTQEEEEIRAKAEVWEREKVQERYWEAMRKGGRWVFADE